MQYRQKTWDMVGTLSKKSKVLTCKQILFSIFKHPAFGHDVCYIFYKYFAAVLVTMYHILLIILL